MTLDDAINYYDGIAKEYRANADIERNDYMDLKDNTAEAEQLASWLNELKLLRERIEKQPEQCEDAINRQAAIDAICTEGTRLERNGTVAMVEIKQWCVNILEELPSVQPKYTCVGCKHYGMYENEVEYGFPSPCTGCKRRADDQYEQ